MIFIGVGSNLKSKFGDRQENINLAISLLEKNQIKRFISLFFNKYVFFFHEFNISFFIIT